MSELKRYTNQTIYATDGSGDTDVYIASEVDAELTRLLTVNSETKALLASAFANANIGAAINRVCKDLPEDWHIEIHLEAGSGWVEIYNPDYERVEPVTDSFESFDDEINSATDQAIAALNTKGE